jgi:hypothetical protein
LTGQRNRVILLPSIDDGKNLEQDPPPASPPTLRSRSPRRAAAPPPELEEHEGHPRDFGNTTLALEDSREQWSFRWIESLRLDLRYAIRGFFRAPLFALTVIGTIGLALGLNTTLFTVFNAYVLRPVAVHDPAGLYEFRWVMRQTGRGRLTTWAEYERLRNSGIGFSEVAAYTNLGARLNGYSMLGHLVTGNYFSMLGVDAAMGRVILPADLAGDADSAVIVLSHSGSNKLGADPNILGSKLVIHGQPLQVIGVTRPSSAASIRSRRTSGFR